MLPFKLVYHDDYDLNLGSHVFPSEKYRLVRDELLGRGIAAPDDFVAPARASRDDLLLVHDAAWIDGLEAGTLGEEEILRLEIPPSPKTVRGFELAAGGSILAADLALRDGIGINLGGGFHHAFPGHGEGFCAINDVAVAVRRLRKDGRIRKAMVVDCDVHQGNGTAAIFAGDDTVFTLSIHQFQNYPLYKPPSNLDIHLPDGVGDQEYLERLAEGMVPALDHFQPDFLLYVAGADPYREDQLGGLALTLEGLKRRDLLVMIAAAQRRVPVGVVLAGGYAMRVPDTVRIHVQTVEAAREALAETGRGSR